MCQIQPAGLLHLACVDLENSEMALSTTAHRFHTIQNSQQDCSTVTRIGLYVRTHLTLLY